MPSTMAPTKAKATYAVTTLSLLTKVMGMLPWFTSLARCNATASDRFRRKKSVLLSFARRMRRMTWLKNREINALKSP